MNYSALEYMKLMTRIPIGKREVSNLGFSNSKDQDESDSYYLQVLNKFQNEGKFLWNGAAALFQGKWLIYRGMFFYAFLDMILSTLALIFAYFILDMLFQQPISDLIFIGFLITFYFISFCFFGKFGNRLYLRFLTKKINKNWNLIPRNNTYGWLVFILWFCPYILIFVLPIYVVKKITFIKELKKA